MSMSLVGCLAPSKQQVVVMHETDDPRFHGSHAVLDGSLQRLAQEMERSIKQMNWAMLRMKKNNIAPIHIAMPACAFCIGEPAYLEAWALMPSGSTVRISGSLDTFNEANPDGLRVGIQVGQFGHPELEARYLHRLQGILKSKPLSERGQTFKMPALKTYQEAYEPKYE